MKEVKILDPQEGSSKIPAGTIGSKVLGSYVPVVINDHTAEYGGPQAFLSEEVWALLNRSIEEKTSGSYQRHQ